MIAAWFTALGHMVRDGWPALGATLAARLAGGALAGLGAWCVTDWLPAAVLGLAVLAGFYTDQLHGEANRGAWRAGIISGCTSLVPLAAAAAGLALDPLWLLIVAAGTLKPPIWRAAWALDPLQFRSDVPQWAAELLEPTRVAATIWGALVGVLLLIVATQGA